MNQATEPMRSSTLVETSARAGEKLRVFLLCMDCASVAHAHWLKEQLNRLAERGFDFTLKLWRLNSAVSGAQVGQAAAEADVLVIAATALNQREPALTQWLNSLPLCDGNLRKASLLIGLFGDDENQARELDWIVRGLVAFARNRGMDFVWQWMERDAMDNNRWLAVRIEQLCASLPACHSPSRLPNATGLQHL